MASHFESSAAEHARRSDVEYDPDASGDEDAAAAQQVLENTQANCKRSRDEASDTQDARSPPREAKRGRRPSGQVSFTGKTQVRVVLPAPPLARAQGEDDDEVHTCDLEVKAKTADGPPLIGMITSAVVVDLAKSNSLDVFRIRHSIRKTLVQCGIETVSACQEVDILYRVHTKLQDYVNAIQARGTVGILPGSMSIGTGGLVVLQKLQGALQEVATAIVAQEDPWRSAFPEAKARIGPLPFHSTSSARPEA